MSSFDLEADDRFRAFRDRPTLDLLLRLPPGFSPREVWDLGCGDGEQAALLSRRYPQAQVHGLDFSARALTPARQRSEAVEWVQGRIEDFYPPVPPDLLFSNSALQWLDDHAAILPRLAAKLAPGGVLAWQFTAPHDEPHQAVLREIAADGPWADALRNAPQPGPSLTSQDYYDALAPVCDEIDLWRSQFLHPLHADEDVVDWLPGAGLQSYLEALPPALWRSFEAVARQRFDRLYPRRPDGVALIPFERIFIVARRR